MKKRRQNPETETPLNVKPVFDLRLFVDGSDPDSEETGERLARLCESRIKGRCNLEIIDITKDPQAALDNRVILVPMLLRHAPEPRVTIIGSLHDSEKVGAALELPSENG